MSGTLAPSRPTKSSSPPMQRTAATHDARSAAASLKAVVMDGVVVGEVDPRFIGRSVSKYTAVNCAIIHCVMSKGATLARACHYLNITAGECARWLIEKPEFAKMVRQAEEISVFRHLGNIDRSAMGGQLKKHKVTIKPNGDKVEESEYTLPRPEISSKMLERIAPQDYGIRRPTPLGTLSSEQLIHDVLGFIAEQGIGAQVVQEAPIASDSSDADCTEPITIQGE